jgi:hypothetical protein
VWDWENPRNNAAQAAQDWNLATLERKVVCSELDLSSFLEWPPRSKETESLIGEYGTISA